MLWNKLFLIILLSSLGSYISGQPKVAITIDDVPNARKFERDNFQAKLLDQLDSMKIPVAVFINEGMIYKTKSAAKNFGLLDQWVKRDYTTLGNHTFSHSRYSGVGYEKFTTDIERGEAITRELSKLHKKQLSYFRFPYNDLGNSLRQKQRIEAFLKENKYVPVPFTIESSDWAFNYLYEYYLMNNNKREAKRIADSYLDITLEFFHYFDSLAAEQYGRHISQIYLCHDNSLNADCLGVLVRKLKERSYSFVSLDEALEDKVYKQKNNYDKKWGISWFYRWMTDKAELKRLKKGEPDVSGMFKEYKRIHRLVK